ncbi:putative ribosomal protein S15 [Aspergillus japonicus CBS 114.51]|uniref:Putative ribosomal protein S15 n=3 Tax=Aspergillus TaxID=5052 RepID=A0A2V5IN23_ASPV1|nr:putative ribosomal protein S15 [Aspergillus japonicus CBS 114.51]PYI21266.1 putative ribosomal protein S15 [Aspergillus violaceofuscus CBS 115571]PYI25648.1 putative ribosomal protein S15 [Aspergillus indologenus CBS 114.80]RAH85356.1 putative ribosomal protein S15 [Aspergillus japonicus CBS 114.51]
MSPRLLLQPSLRAFTGSSSIQSPLAALSLNPSKTTIRAGSAEARERRRHDPFLTAQSRQRKAANLSRRQALAQEREQALGDPVKSAPTPFIQELEGTQMHTETAMPNFFVKPTELERALAHSKDLTSPLVNPDRDTADPQLEMEQAEQHHKQHANALEAMNRILNLENGNNQDRMRLRIQRCIETFGRHNTDQTLPPKPASVSLDSATARPEKFPRVGADTGSPEVQVAILTAKIINLSKHLETTNKDKHNKRNLRLLVHKRQKLLRYLRRKERGGPRWQNLVQTLGLSDAAWQGEISM